MESPIATQQQHYTKIRVLGKGSMGKACLMQSKQDNQLYVVKRIRTEHLSDKQRQSVFKEAYMMQKLSHPNVIQFKEIYTTRKQKLCIVMEYAENGDLDGKVAEQQAKGKHFQEQQVLAWFGQLVAGTAYIHSRNIIHRDLKGANVFMGKEQVCKIGDFGIAKYMNQTVDSRVFAGTPGYLSPQMVQGKPYSSKADIWALGVILYQLCTFKLPFQANSLPLLALRILRGSFAPLPKGAYSKQMSNLILSLLKVDQNKRPSAAELLKHPMVKPYVMAGMVMTKTLSSTIIKEGEDKREALRREMREDLRKKRVAAKASIESAPTSSVKKIQEKKVIEKKKEPEPEVEKEKPKEVAKPWKLNKKHKSTDIEVEVFVPVKKQKKPPVVQELPPAKDFVVEIKISDKVRQRIEQQELRKNQPVFEQIHRLSQTKLQESHEQNQSVDQTAPSSSTVIHEHPHSADQQHQNSPQHNQSDIQQQINVHEDVKNAVSNVNQVLANIQMEDIHFSQYEDSYNDLDSTTSIPEQRPMSRQQEESMKYITNSSNLEELREVLESWMGQENFMRAYKLVRQRMEKRETEDVYDIQELRKLLYFVDSETFERNILLLLTIMSLENQQMMANLDD